MALSERQVSGGIRFGDWMLAPMDERNWELCHWHVAKATGRHSGGDEPKWNRLGRYYQHNTFDQALLYATDVELKAKCRDEAIELNEALREHERIFGTLMDVFLHALKGVA